MPTKRKQKNSAPTKTSTPWKYTRSKMNENINQATKPNEPEIRPNPRSLSPTEAYTSVHLIHTYMIHDTYTRPDGLDARADRQRLALMTIMMKITGKILPFPTLASSSHDLIPFSSSLSLFPLFVPFFLFFLFPPFLLKITGVPYDMAYLLATRSAPREIIWARGEKKIYHRKKLGSKSKIQGYRCTYNLPLVCLPTHSHCVALP